MNSPSSQVSNADNGVAAPQEEPTAMQGGLSFTATAAALRRTESRQDDDPLDATATLTTTVLLDTPTPTIQSPLERTAAPTPMPLIRVQDGFVQRDGAVTYAFVARNPNPAQSLRDTKYQVAAYDANGVVLGISGDTINEIGPGQELGIVNSMQIAAQVEVSRIEVQLRDGQVFEQPSFLAELTVTNPAFIPGDQTSVTGTVNNGRDRDVERVTVFAITYNGQRIVGGGSASVAFVPANGQAPVSIPVVTSDEVTHAGFWVVLSTTTTEP
ncbi:MAG: hypothetical protein EI684_23380 [Candidatus Viridilinea halotolerans]|uniref:Uncharacterized protein n=1 Tax=Candidatus Viridilinea halotolerans TaxID=2491704 RepID=A0A426TQ78_9CHLR|nr:MAG: hypothetical protein EI684_23380 [Candidatus Viridilinea halotolerans]